MSLSNLLSVAAAITRWLWSEAVSLAREHPWQAAVLVYGIVRAFGVTIQSGQRGVLFRWGRAVRELEPGFHWLIPLFDGVKKTPARSVTIDLADQKAMTADGLVYDVGVNVVYRVENATKAMTLVDHLDHGCRSALPIIITDLLRTRVQAELVDRVLLDRELHERLNAWVARWGLVIEHAGFTTIAPDHAVLATTQLRSRTLERAGVLRTLMDDGIAAETALVMLGSERGLVAKSKGRRHRESRRGHRSLAGQKRGAEKLPLPAIVNGTKSPQKVEPPRKDASGRKTRKRGR